MGDALPTQTGLPFQETENISDWQNPKVFRRNTQPPRCYYIPETSLLLNGKWDFSYNSCPEEAPRPDNNESLQVDWSKINVPGHWQLQGSGNPHYTNTQFPIPVCPPYVPTENPTGSYRRQFHVPRSWDSSDQLIVRFDGVDCAYHVWVNGALVGYAEGSRNASEYDISSFVDRAGSNELFVNVYQWSSSTYIEDQDQWWLSGIFRDVTLIAFPSAHRIKDWFIRTDLDSQYQNATLQLAVDVKVSKTSKVSVALSELPKNGGALIKTHEVSVKEGESTMEIALDVADPKKWTAEMPYLYRVDIHLDSNSVHQNVGFRKVEIKSGLLTVNGVPIRIHGVNRHDHHPRHGRAVPLEFMKQDLLLMKAHNINSLRCSHYPPHPALLEMTDELGLWVMDEADMETHGFYDAVARPLDVVEESDYEERKKITFPQAAAFTTDDPEWRDAYVDRMVQLVQRDKNHASVIMWSLGNEAFYGKNIKAMSDYAKAFDSTRPIHYEGDAQADCTDMYSYMYPSVNRLINLTKTEGVKEDGSFDKPMVLCEYAHAMGNGPGGLDDYIDAFEKHPRLQGGYIWEWANHGLWKEDGNGDGEGYHAYGGDFGEYPHDGTFVMDGLLHSTHEPTPGLVELKKAYQPLKLSVRDGKLVIENKYDFVGIEHLLASYKVEEMGERSSLISAGQLTLPTISAGKTVDVNLPSFDSKTKADGNVFLTVVFRLGQAATWTDQPHKVAWVQHQLSESDIAPLRPALNTSQSDIRIIKSRTFTKISGADWSFAFDTARGLLTSWTADGRSLLDKDPVSGGAIVPSIWRPATDNDMPHSLPYWVRFGVPKMTSQLRNFKISQGGNGVEVSAETFLTPPLLAWGLKTTTVYKICNNGSIKVNVSMEPTGRIPNHIPRIGLNLRLPKSLNTVKYLGLGPGEAYPDKMSSQHVGIYSASVAELHQHYDVPQEGSNRMAARYVNLAEENGFGLRCTASEPKAWTNTEERKFNWRASHYSDQSIQDAKHPVDLVEDDATLLRLDARVAGVGTGACGPGVREDLLVKPEHIKFGFLLEITGN